MPPKDIWELIGRNGLPAVLLVVVLFFGYKGVIPFMLKLFAAHEQMLVKQAEDARTQLVKQTEVSEMRLIRQGEEFTKALASAMERQTVFMTGEFSKMHMRLDDRDDPQGRRGASRK